MKYLLLNLILIGAVSGCSSDESPQKVTENFMHALEKKDIEKALTYVSRDTRELFEVMLKVMLEKNHKSVGEWKLGETQVITDSIAAVRVFVEGKSPLGVYLMKVEAGWKIFSLEGAWG